MENNLKSNQLVGIEKLQTSTEGNNENSITDLDETTSANSVIFNNIPIPILIHNIDGVLFDINAYGCVCFGIDRHNAMLHNVIDFVTNEASKASILQTFENVCAGNTKTIRLEAIKFDNNTLFNVEISMLPAIWNGKQCIISIMHIITNQDTENTDALEREHQLKFQNEELITLNDDLAESYRQIQIINEQMVLAKEQAEESDCLKSAFLANMSHEIRTPLNGIVGFAHMLTEKNLDSDSLNQYVSIINNCSYQLLTIIDDIIDISKIEAGQLKISNTLVNINTLLFELQSFYASNTDKANIEILIRPGMADENCNVLADPVRLRQVLNNLINNAIKFTPHGTIMFGYEVKRTSLEFFVSDTGIGIASEHLKVIFERFRQVENNETRNFGGTGLGLAISKALVNLMGGAIWVESNTNTGSTFYFRIPLNIMDDTRHRKPSKTRKHELLNLNGKTILIAEDEEFNYRFLEELLKKSGATILWAKDGIEAIEMCKQKQEIDLVLMDIKMPHMNGLEATKVIKQFNKNIQIIAQTAYAMANDREKAKDAGCDNYISKPIDKSELFTMIYNHLVHCNMATNMH